MQAHIQIHKLIILELQRLSQIRRGICRLTIKTRTSHKHGGFFHGCFQRPNSDFTRFPYQYMKRPDCHCLLGFELVQIFAKYARVAWPNKYHEFKLPVEQAICPPDHPSVVYQPRLRSLLTTIQKVNDQCWWSQNIKISVFNWDPTRIQNEWLP